MIRANKLARVWLEDRTHERIHGAFQPESRVNPEAADLMGALP